MARLKTIQRSIDRATLPFKNSSLSTPHEGWIRRVRLSLGMSQVELARILKINQRSLHQLEVSEALKNIRLSSLERAAEALDCELVYAFVPRNSIESQYEAQARKMAREQIAAVEHNMRLEKQEHTFGSEEVEEIARELIRKNAITW